MTSQQRSLNTVLRKIRRSFLSLAKAFDGLAPALSSAAPPRGTSNGREPLTKSGRRRPRLSAAQRRALKLQGKYMGTMRGLKPNQQARVKAVRKTRGIHAAIAEARRLSRS